MSANASQVLRGFTARSVSLCPFFSVGFVSSASMTDQNNMVDCRSGVVWAFQLLCVLNRCAKKKKSVKIAF